MEDHLTDFLTQNHFVFDKEKDCFQKNELILPRQLVLSIGEVDTLVKLNWYAERGFYTIVNETGVCVTNGYIVAQLSVIIEANIFNLSVEYVNCMKRHLN